MAAFNASVLMKELRKASGFTQRQVAEGICSRGTLASLEVGHRKPDWFTFKNVLLKLGVDPTLYYNDIISADEAYIMSQSIECTQLVRASNLEQLKCEIEKMEQDPVFSEGLGRRVYLGVKGTYYTLCHMQSQEYLENGITVDKSILELALQHTMELLNDYRPDFDIEKVPNYFLSNDELKAVDRLANIYLFLGDAEKSLNIRYMVFDNLKGNYKVDFIEDLRFFHIGVIANIAATLLSHLHRYDECLNMAEKGIEQIRDRASIYEYYHLSYVKSYALLHLGRKEEGEELLKKCIMFSHGAEKYLPPDLSVDYQKELFIEKFGYKFDLTVTIPWD